MSRISDVYDEVQPVRPFQFTGRIRSFYHTFCGIFAHGSLSTQCVGSRLRHARSSFCGVLLSYFGSGLVLDHSRYFTGLDS